MKLLNYPLLCLTLLIVSGCAGAKWYQGGMIQYKTIEKVSETEYVINVLGSLVHGTVNLESAVLDKAASLCGGAAEILDTQIGSYESVTAGGGAVFEATNPEITSRVRCK